jgi:beta-lactamase class A
LALGILLDFRCFSIEDTLRKSDLQRNRMSDLERRLDAEAASLPARVGYALENLSTGERADRDADSPYPTASSIKLPILTAFHAFVNAGGAAWDDEVAVDRALSFGGSGILQNLSLARLSYRDAAWLMICLSDNFATNILLDAMTVDGANRIMADLIGDGIRVNNLVGIKTATPGRSMGTATPSAFRRYLRDLESETLPGAAETLAVARQQQGRGTITRYLSVDGFAPGPLVVASKSGAVPNTRSGIAVLTEGDRRATMTFMITDHPDRTSTLENEAEKCIGRMARIAYDEWLAPAS